MVRNVQHTQYPGDSAGQQGVAVLDFGDTPVSEGHVFVEGQFDLGDFSHVRAWITGGETEDNTESDHMLAGMWLATIVSSCNAGRGFNISARARHGLYTGKFLVKWQWSD